MYGPSGQRTRLKRYTKRGGRTFFVGFDNWVPSNAFLGVNVLVDIFPRAGAGLNAAPAVRQHAFPLGFARSKRTAVSLLGLIAQPAASAFALLCRSRLLIKLGWV